MGRREFTKALPLALVALTACFSDSSGAIEIFVDADHETVMASFVEHIGDSRISLIASTDPRAAAHDSRAEVRLAMVTDFSGCQECFRIDEHSDGVYEIRGDQILGAQYGVAQALEDLGYRFFHPWKTYRPSDFAAGISPSTVGKVFEPEMSVRGIQLQTLHPIEALYAYWIPGQENLESALRINDWLIKNRANYVQWAALDNIASGDVERAEWSEHTRAIVEDIHARGMRAGINVQLFAESNLQRALDLIDASAFDVEGEEPEENEPEWIGFTDEERAIMSERMSARLAPLIEAGVDNLTLSFGEFIGEKPQKLIDAIDTAYDVARGRDSDLEISAVIHVGDSKKLRVSYDDNEMSYYFLVQYANSSIVPQVHTVMYYNLFEGAGGAYGHDNFDEHRDYLLDRLGAGERVAYFPESANWGAFDNSVPTYSPIYMRSRWLDVEQLNRLSLAGGGSPLDEHIVFSSGWEWGYWQNDYAVLRDGFTHASSWQDRLHQMFAPMGDEGIELADIIADVAETQQEYLVGAGLAPYIAGRNAIMDAGFVADIVAAPERPEIAAIQDYSSDELDELANTVLGPLAALADRQALQLARLHGLSLSNDWFREVEDGMHINLLRTRFALAVFAGAHDLAKGGDARDFRDRARSALDAAQKVVRARRRGFHHPDAGLLTSGNTNPSLYQFGYLHHADTLCYWERELIQLWNLASRDREPVPACFF